MEARLQGVAAAVACGKGWELAAAEEEAATGLSSDTTPSAGLLPVSRMLLVSLPDELL